MGVVPNSRDYDIEEDLEGEYYGEYEEEELYDYADYRCTIHIGTQMFGQILLSSLGDRLNLLWEL